MFDEVEKLKIENCWLQEDLDNLDASANEMAEKAKTQHSVNFLIQSNSLRRSAKQKLVEIAVVDLQLDAGLLKSN